jgi:hypothetical protein
VSSIEDLERRIERIEAELFRLRGEGSAPGLRRQLRVSELTLRDLNLRFKVLEAGEGFERFNNRIGTLTKHDEGDTDRPWCLDNFSRDPLDYYWPTANVLLEEVP